MIDYLKCIYANKATLWGVISMTSAITIQINFSLDEILEHNSYYGGKAIEYFTYGLFFSGGALLLLTSLGIETYSSYKKTKGYIEEDKGKIRNSLRNSATNGRYCNRKGIALAIQEAEKEQRRRKRKISHNNFL